MKRSRNCRRRLRLDPAHAEAHSNLGVALARRGRTAEAIEHYREALRLDPRQTQAYSNLGNALLAQGHVSEAIAQFEAALALDPSDPQARTNLAGAFVREGRVEDAIAELERAPRTTPGFQPAGAKLRGTSTTRTLRKISTMLADAPSASVSLQKSSCAPTSEQPPLEDAERPVIRCRQSGRSMDRRRRTPRAAAPGWR